MDFSLLHGECVSLGIVTASFLSMTLGHISKEEHLDICKILKAFHLPVSLPSNMLNLEEIVAATKNDKKMDSGKIKFILLESIGTAYINKELTDEQLELFEKDPAKAIQELDLDLELVIDDWEVDGYGDPYDVQYTIWKEEKGNG